MARVGMDGNTNADTTATGPPDDDSMVVADFLAA